MVNWMAVLYGIVAAFVIGLISGLGLPFTDATLPTIGAGLSGLIAGGVAGYYNHNGLGSGAVHGLLATTIGGIIVSLVLLVLGTLTLGLFGFGAAITFLFLVLATGIPGAVGGALGGMIRGEPESMGRPTA